MNLKPHNQRKLFGHQKIFNELISLYSKKKLPNKILFSGLKGVGKSTLACHLTNYIFSVGEENSYDVKNQIINESNITFKLINNGSHPNFYVLDLLEDKKKVEISQVRKMIEYTNKSSFKDLPRIILINDIENLNINSLNALLKVIEEPNNNIYFILIHNIEKKILPTLKSRCLNYKINLSFDETIHITNNLINENFLNKTNNDLINYYSTPGYFLNLLKFSEDFNIDLNKYDLRKFISYLITQNMYKKSEFIKRNIFDFIELYFLKLFNENSNSQFILQFYQTFIKKVSNSNRFNLDHDSLLIEFKSKILNG